MLTCTLGLSGAAASAEPLRLLALGDSITWGWGSESTYGYRQPLGDLLTFNGIAHEYVGTISDNLTFLPTRFLDPPLRAIPGSPAHYGIPGANADELDPITGQSVQSPDSLLWSIRNDQDGDKTADPAFAAVGGLIPTLVNQNQAPDAILLHIGTNSVGRSDLAVTPTPGLYNDNAADSQLYRLLTGLGQDLTANGLLTGSAFDTRILLARIIPRPVNDRGSAQGGPGQDKVDDDVLLNSINYNAAMDAVVASLSPVLQQAITFVDMWDVNLADPSLDLASFRNDGVYDQPFDTFAGSLTRFNEAGDTVGGLPVHEANPNGPDYADWLLRYAEERHAFYDAAVAENEMRWNQGLYGIQIGSDFFDAIHPNANGYNLMAHLWYQGLFRSGAVAVIPEPAWCGLALLAGALVARRRVGGVRVLNAG